MSSPQHLQTLAKFGIPVALLALRGLRGLQKWSRGKTAPLGWDFWLPTLVLVAFTAARFAVYNHTSILDPFEILKTPPEPQYVADVVSIVQEHLSHLDFGHSLKFIESNDLQLWAGCGSALTRCPYNDGGPMVFTFVALPPVFLRGATYVLQTMLVSRISVVGAALGTRLMILSVLTMLFDFGATFMPSSIYIYRTNCLRMAEVGYVGCMIAWMLMETRYFKPNRQGPLELAEQVLEQLATQNRVNCVARDIERAAVQSPEMRSQFLNWHATEKDASDGPAVVKIVETGEGQYSLVGAAAA